MPRAERALVVGGNVAGLACAAALHRIGMHVTVLESSVPTAALAGVPGAIDTAAPQRHAAPPSQGNLNNDYHGSVSPLGIGVWSTALRALQSIDPDTVQSLHERGTWMPNGGYRDVSGSWLMAAAAPLARSLQENRPGLLFVSHSDLRTSMQAMVEDLPRVRVVRAAHFERYESQEEGGGVEAMLSDGTRHHADILVGADGAQSRVRQQLAGAGAGTALEPRGYTVFRGHALHSSMGADLPPREAFQTWGPRSRFAAVPFGDGFTWFATIADAPLEFSDCGSAGAEREARKRALLEHFDEWHDPVKQMIEGCSTHILCEQAEAHAKDVCCSDDGRIALVGDARGALDPILAQGASMALEDAAALGAALHAHRALGSSLPDALRTYAQQRTARVSLLRRVSDVSQLMATPTEGVSAIRNALLGRVPAALSSPIFEYAMKMTMRSALSPFAPPYAAPSLPRVAH